MVKFEQSSDIDFETNGLPDNYTNFLNQLEKLAKEASELQQLQQYEKSSEPIHREQMMNDAEYSRFVTDVWIGVVLTLLVLTVVIFICSCFLYHKFQQWKRSCAASLHAARTPCDGIQRFEFEVESLPSYTLVSGLPTYDDALEQFRKSCCRQGIILQPLSVVKIFDELNKKIGDNVDGEDNQSVNSSACTCGQGSSNQMSSIIELSPDQLKSLSQKRLSLQIAFNTNIRGSGRGVGRIDLRREVSRSNLLRSHDLPQTHRSANALATDPELTRANNRLSVFSHRGSFS